MMDEQDERRLKIGRVYGFRVLYSSSEVPEMTARRDAVRRAAYKREGARVTEPGFDRPTQVARVLATRYVEEKQQTIMTLDGASEVPVLNFVNCFDLGIVGRRGFLLLGGASQSDATHHLSKYLETIGAGPKETSAVPMSLSDAAIKEVYFDREVSRRGLSCPGITKVILRTAAPDLTRTSYYQALEAAHIADAEWDSCDLSPPPIPGLMSPPPVVKVYPDGLMSKAPFTNPDTWEYLRWLLARLEVSASALLALRKRVRPLSEFTVESEETSPGTAGRP